MRYILDTGRDEFGRIDILYGARNPGLLLYKDELKEWSNRKDLNLVLTIDKEAEGWTGKVGLIPNVLKEIAPSSDGAYALVCGPPIMIKYTLPAPPACVKYIIPNYFITFIPNKSLRMSCFEGCLFFRSTGRLATNQREGIEW